MNVNNIDIELRYNNIFIVSKIEDQNIVMLFKNIVLKAIRDLYYEKYSFIKYPRTKEEIKKLFEEIFNGSRDKLIEIVADQIQIIKSLLEKSNEIIYGEAKYTIEDHNRKKLLKLISDRNLFIRIFDHVIFPFVKIKQKDKLKN